ncbi:MAG: hypothetical protein ACPG1C_04165 [Alphaproteobacteria bacterium]
MISKRPNFPTRDFAIFQQEIYNAFGLRFDKDGERIEDEKFVVKLICNNAEWAKSNGQTTCIIPEGFVKAANDIAANAGRMNVGWQVANPGNYGVSVYLNGPETQNNFYRARLETFLEGMAKNDADALDKLVAHGVMSYGEANARKKTTGKEIKKILSDWDRDAARGAATYEKAYRTLRDEHRRTMANAREVGKKLRDPVSKARAIVAEAVQDSTRINGGLPRSGGASDIQVQNAKTKLAGYANDLVGLGTLGKVIFVGTAILQMHWAYENDDQAGEFDTLFPDDMTQTAASLALGVGAAIVLAPLLPAGLIAGTLAGILIGIAADEVASGVFAIVKQEFEGEEPTEP